jgi:hypothetical protein
MVYHNTDPAESTVHVLSNGELAQLFREWGDDVVLSHGQYWRCRHGFYQPLHWAATMRASEARRPSPLCWGFHALLVDEDAEYANAQYAIHLVRDLSTYDESALGAETRRLLRRCRETMNLVQITDPCTLRDQGWGPYSDKTKRVGLPLNTTQEEYVAGVDRLVNDKRRLTFGAMLGDELLGYVETFAVEGTVHFWDMFVSNEALPRNVTAFLHFESAQVYRRNQGVTQLYGGIPLLDRSGVSDFKRRLGMPIVMVPARFWALPGVKAILKKAKPHTYYRLSGQPLRGMTS